MVCIYGEVQKPGALRLERGMNVMQALAAGGGVTLRGTQRGMKLHRRDAEGRVTVLDPAMPDTLVDGDVIHVRESLFRAGAPPACAMRWASAGECVARLQG